MAKRKPRQSYTDDFKRRAVADTIEIARRHDMNANVLFSWRKNPRFIPDAEDVAFLPVTIDALPSTAAANPPENTPVMLPQELGIWIAGDVRLVVKGGFEPETLGRLIRFIRTTP